ncbi:ErmE/ErmH/ErmO/ErmR family 23S rRNA (adenine(2058)-N(6))-methyltransferase [Streptomyces sp. YIM 98790]|uniref:ErmE/ErmH/ErmO/ErmR family 23S rRNA (adenine(2058)-N(6))-methyltransferase n=1 Tax=Streptomyces sp. YIM 98790 TaxID=2689077 RepID=UPI0014076842|nr:ErmE/ErmH/ErmO/ErmR family 23S rRNA (adenine(2058)-N(6))-methyltransferase [Streptomyces sp. YIM 98790]
MVRPEARRRARLSQNFLTDGDAVRLIVRCSGVRPGDLVVEPGAGEGALTRPLARRVRARPGGGAGRTGRVLAYEIDPALARRLTRRLGDDPAVRVLGRDFLAAAPPAEPFAVVGNIPYARTSEIVRWCLAARSLTSATLLTQREYARKRTGGYGRWTLRTVQTWPEIRWRLGPRVGREAFAPVPRTDAAVLRLERRRVPLLPPTALPGYRSLVAEGFGGVGGSLRATLSRGRPAGRVRAAFRAAELDPGAPVGHVTPAQWLALFRALTPPEPPRPPRRPRRGG